MFQDYHAVCLLLPPWGVRVYLTSGLFGFLAGVAGESNLIQHISDPLPTRWDISWPNLALPSIGMYGRPASHTNGQDFVGRHRKQGSHLCLNPAF